MPTNNILFYISDCYFIDLKSESINTLQFTNLQ